jgi:transposase
MKENKVWLGMDVHKNTIALAGYVNYEDRTRFEKTIIHEKQAVKKEFKKISAIGEINCCYEAGFSGFDLYRFISALGYDCKVIAPSLTPKKADKVKTDKKDAKKLASLFRADLLTVVKVPGVENEQDRALLRLRGQFKKDTIRAKHRITKFLALKGLSFKGRNWSLDHKRYLNNLDFKDSDRITFSEYLTCLQFLELRLKEIDAEIDKLAQEDRYKLKVNALKCFRGIGTLSAMTILTELEHPSCFEPHKLMSYFGLTPSEHSSGESNYRGSITKQGNARLRHIIIEAAWHYLKRPNIGKTQSQSFIGQDKEIVLIAIKALKRLNKRFWHLSLKKDKNIAVVAVARELVGFIWAALMRLQALEA